ncbi:MAG: hypothetical protein MK073_02640, partial [Phycisphaerales bacterium]|nr:hypothetical protein [Phycisphaerales bacterium]
MSEQLIALMKHASECIAVDSPIVAGPVSGSFTTLAACDIGQSRSVLLLMAHDDDADDAFATCSEQDV